jgi:hypothetical protein
MLKPPNLFRTILVNGRMLSRFAVQREHSLESHPQVEDLKVPPLGHAQAEGVSLAVARDNSGSDVLHNLYVVSGLQNKGAESNISESLDRLVYSI